MAFETLSRSFFTLSVSLFISCGGGGGSDNVITNCFNSGYDIYLGYYAEDRSNNPEDPTIGAVVACFPSTDGAFKSQFLFSYEGCTGGADIGVINGSRSGDTVSGNWEGVIDGYSFSGTFDGSYDGTKFSGVWDNSAGKVQIRIGSCSYFVAAYGTWVLYGLNIDGGLGINIDTTSSPISITWNNTVTGADTYRLDILDKQCLYERISIPDCTKWSIVCSSSVNTAVYGTVPSGCLENYPDQPLTTGKEYITAVTAYDSSNADVKAFGNTVFTSP
ncbi:hypothetical protein [Persephonella sp.]